MKIVRFVVMLLSLFLSFSEATLTITLREQDDNRIKVTFDGTLDLSERDSVEEQIFIPIFGFYFASDQDFEATLGGVTTCSEFGDSFTVDGSCLQAGNPDVFVTEAEEGSTLSSGISIFEYSNETQVCVQELSNVTVLPFDEESVVFLGANFASLGLIDGSKCSYEFGDKLKVEILVVPTSSGSPSAGPTNAPSSDPSVSPSGLPSSAPSVTPSFGPSSRADEECSDLFFLLIPLCFLLKFFGIDWPF